MGRQIQGWKVQALRPWRPPEPVRIVQGRAVDRSAGAHLSINIAWRPGQSRGPGETTSIFRLTTKRSDVNQALSQQLSTSAIIEPLKRGSRAVASTP